MELLGGKTFLNDLAFEFDAPSWSSTGNRPSFVHLRGGNAPLSDSSHGALASKNTAPPDP